LDILLRAFPLVLREVPEAKLLLMGNDPIRPELVARVHRSLLDIADAFGFGDALLFLDGPIPQEEVPEVFAASDVVVSPGATECFGMVFLDGMAAGRPVVGVHSVDNGVPEVVPDGRAGILVPHNDPGTTAKALTSLLLDPEGTAAMGERGLAWVKKRYDASSVLSRLLDTYFECRAEAGRG
jgi:phosphatidylinositol alpha-1,6-mannosyltransferase